MDLSTVTGLALIGLLLSLWALNWARRAANAAERTAIAAEKSALAAERSAMSAKRGAEAAEASAVAAKAAAGVPAYDDPAQARAARLDAVVKQLVDEWPEEASAWPLVERNRALADEDVDEIIQKAFHQMGRTDGEARQHVVAVLNMRRDQKR